jgi:hypothetical protein
MNNQNYYQDNMQPMYGPNPFTGYPPRNQPNSRFRGPQPVQAPYYNQFVPTSNKQFVDSLEHALSLPADYNSENVYFDKNIDVMYNICTNGRGEKSYTILEIKVKNTQNNAQSGADLYAVYDERLKRLEHDMEVLNGKYNVEQTNTKSE